MTRPRTIIVAVSPSVEARAASWLGPIADAWPGQDAKPQCELVSFDMLMARVELAGSGPGLGTIGTVLVAFGPEVTRSEMCRLLDRLHESFVPAVALLSKAEQAAWSTHAGSVVIDRLEAPRERIASLLYAVTERQPVVQGLAQELRITHTSHGGLRGEMDKIREELHHAGVVQRELLPRTLPAVPGLDFAALYRPVGYVSGDIYDARLIDENRVAVFIADAVGHGVPAALLTIALRHSLTTHDREGDRWLTLEPAEALARLNRHLCEREHPVQRFATAVYGHIDIRTRRVTIAGAGHPPPLLFRGGQTERVETEGPLLGVFREAEFNQTSFVVEPGNTLVMYTDGFESAFPEDAHWQTGTGRFNQRYIEQLGEMARQASSPGGSVETAMQTLEQYIDSQAGSLHQVDDVTALALSVPIAAVAAKAA